MKKVIIALSATLALVACGGGGNRPGPIDIPDEPKQQEIIQEEVPVPLVCQVTVTRPSIPVDTLPQGRPLEDQNAALRSSIADQSTYINDLEAAVIGCGGTVVDSRGNRVQTPAQPAG